MINFLCGYIAASIMWAVVYAWLRKAPDKSELWPDVKDDDEL